MGPKNSAKVKLVCGGNFWPRSCLGPVTNSCLGPVTIGFPQCLVLTMVSSVP